MRRIAYLCILALSLLPQQAFSRIHRSTAVRREFMRMHPCPSTGKKYGGCPGWIADHRVALCKGGPDKPSNLQWQTVAAAKAKDKWECK